MTKLKFIFIFFLCSYSLFTAQANDNKESTNTKKNARKADNYFVFSKYMDALPLYENLVKDDPENIEYNYRLGLCYYFSNKDILKSISYFEKAKNNFKPNDTIAELYLWLGYAYHIKNDFEKAIENYSIFKPYIEKYINGIEGIIEIDKDIERCKRGIEFKKNAGNVLITNAGTSINSEFPDYAPVLTADENTLLFTSKRKGSTGNKLDEDKFYFEDVYISSRNKDTWNQSHLLDSLTDKNKNIATNKNNINTKKHDASVAISPDGKQLFIYRSSDIWVSNLKDEKWTKPEKLNQIIDAKKSHEPSVSISIDKNTLYFVSERKGGYGGKDIYKATKLEDGNWGNVSNLGPEINTIYDEDAPFIDKETGELYFSSEGHNSIGGFDVFKTKLANNKWETPENLGWPINSGADDIFYILNNNKDKAFFTSMREDGLGNYDIYEVSFLDKMQINANYIVKNKSTNKEINSLIKIIQDNVVIDSISQNTNGQTTYKANKTYQMMIPNGINNKLNTLTYTTPKKTKADDEYFHEIVFEDEKDEKGNTIGIRTTVYNTYNNLKDQSKSNYTLKDIENTEKTSFVDYYELPIIASEQGVKFKTILFDFEKDNIKDEWEEELKKVLNYLETNKTVTMNIIGHTDSKGSDLYNYALSLKRANQVKRYLTSNGIDIKRLNAKGEGEKQPVESNETPDGSDNENGRKQNRRVEFFIISK